MIEVEVYEVSITGRDKPIVFLKEKEDTSKRLLPIWIAELEAASIRSQLIKDTAPLRPMTHDLMKNIIEIFDAKVVSICVYAMKEETFYGRVTLEAKGESIEIDSRPSDAIALALRFGATLYVAEDVMRENGVSHDDHD